MPQVDVQGNAIIVGGRRVPLLAAQFDFYRHVKLFWRPILREIRNAGFPIVSTFVCWDFHEIEPGSYDFVGETESARDLVGFLQMCREEDLLVLVRPGPIIDDEWPTRGPAADVCTRERTDPVFRERAGQWLAAVGDVIREHQVSAGGAVALVHLDNEVFYPHVTESSATEADASYHIPYHEQIVLTDLAAWTQDRQRMGDAQLGPKLSAVATGTASPRTPSFDSDSLTDTIAAFGFVSDMVSSYHRWVRDTLRAQGVEVPVVANIKHGLAYLDWAKLEADVDLLGCNNYLDNLRSEQEYLNLTWWYGLQRARLRTTWAPEFWCGSWVEIGQDTTLFEPGHYEYVLMNAIAHGLRGANFFMFVDRDDWHYSPISGIGKPRPHLLQPFKRALPLLSELRDDRRLARIGLVWTPEHHQAFQATRHADWTTLSSIWWEDDQPKEFADWWETLRVLVEQDRDFVILDPGRGSYDGLDVLVYAGPDWASEHAIAALSRWVDDGGRLVVTGDVPRNRLDGRPAEQAAALEQRAVVCAPRDVETVLNVEDYVRVDRPGCASFAYVSEDYVAVFVCNRTQRPLPVKVSLHPDLIALLPERDSSDLQSSGSAAQLALYLDRHTVEARMWHRGRGTASRRSRRRNDVLRRRRAAGR